MRRSLTDVTIGIATGLLLASLAGGVFGMTQRGACYDAQVTASAWTSSNTDQSMPAAVMPDCAGWDAALKVIAATGLASLFSLVGLVILRTRSPSSLMAAP